MKTTIKYTRVKMYYKSSVVKLVKTNIALMWLVQ